MKNYAKYCYISSDKKLLQMNLTESALSNATIIERFLTKSRVVCPFMLVMALVTLFLGIKVFPILLFPSVFGASMFSIFTISSFVDLFSQAKAYNAIAKNDKLKKLLKSYYSDMKEYEKIKTNHNKFYFQILKKQSNLTSNLLKSITKLQKNNLKKMKNYERKMANGRELTTIQQFAYDQLETTRDSIDKFIFHNFSLLSEFCPTKIDFITNRANAYLSNVLLSNKNYYDEYVWSGAEDEVLVKNDDILKRETEYFSELCKKLNSLVSHQNDVVVKNLDDNLPPKLRTQVEEVFETKREFEEEAK